MALYYFLAWHYGDGLRAVFRHALRRVAGFLNYFSVRELARTLFHPWHRILESYGRGFDTERFFTALAGNLISRLLGVIARALLIATGIAAGIAAGLFGFLALALWLIAPALIPLLLLAGLLILLFG